MRKGFPAAVSLSVVAELGFLPLELLGERSSGPSSHGVGRIGT